MNYSDQNENYAELAAKWIDRSISLQERQKFNDWYHQGQNQPLFIPKAFAADAETHKARIYREVLEGMEGAEVAPASGKFWKRISIAASICILFSVALYFYTQYTPQFDLNQLANQYGPGSNVAILTDQDGKQFLLEDSIFNMSAKGRLNPGTGNGFVKITTPKGSHHQVLLGDGTKVWLGAASSIFYPVRFNGPERNIRFSGEAYFEVAHNAEKPFHVNVIANKYQINITVIGTKFNVSAYPEDSEVKTRVFEGAVKVSSGNHSAVLTKGEKVVFKAGVLQPKVKEVEMDWMGSEILHFDDDNIEQVMWKLAKEYNVKFIYRRTAKTWGEPRLTGIISRRKSLQTVLKLIEATGNYRFTVDNQQVTVFDVNSKQH